MIYVLGINYKKNAGSNITTQHNKQNLSVCVTLPNRWWSNSGEVLCHIPDSGILQEI